MKDCLERRLRMLEAKATAGTLVLQDGSFWKPKIGDIEMLVTLMESADNPALLAPEVRAEAEMWTRYAPRPNEGALRGFVSLMAKELLK